MQILGHLHKCYARKKYLFVIQFVILSKLNNYIYLAWTKQFINQIQTTASRLSQNPDDFFFVLVLWNSVWLDYKEVKKN